jgi:hypothetical protein
MIAILVLSAYPPLLWNESLVRQMGHKLSVFIEGVNRDRNALGVFTACGYLFSLAWLYSLFQCIFLINHTRMVIVGTQYVCMNMVLPLVQISCRRCRLHVCANACHFSFFELFVLAV